jgi:hypothetical protein
MWMGTAVEKVKRLKFLGVHIADKLKWSTHTDSVVKKAQAPKNLTIFYRCAIESILSACITAWYSNCTALNRRAL